MKKQQIISALSNINPNATFISVMGYTNEQGEKSNFNILFNTRYDSTVKKSIAILENYKPISKVETQAKKELLMSFNTSLDKCEKVNQAEVVDSCYIQFVKDNKYIKGLKMHLETGDLYITGLLVNKEILVPGEYKFVNSSALTIAKNKLRALCPISKFRQFKISASKLDHITVNKVSIVPNT